MHKIVLLFLLCFFAGLTQAQDGYIDDNENSLWNQGDWGNDGGTPRNDEDPLPPEFNEEELYFTEDELNQVNTDLPDPFNTVSPAQALESSRPLLFTNISYGFGTGVLVGGWLALFNGANARENLRFLGTGAVFGSLLGFAIGTKAFYQAPPQTQNFGSIPSQGDKFPLKHSTSPLLTYHFTF